MEDIYDVLILGAGPAGLTAAIYSARYNLKTLVISKEFGGTANLAPEIENWPGFSGSGIDLMNRFKSQAESFGVEFDQNEILEVVRESELFEVITKSGKFKGRTLIISLGTEHKKLNIEGEKEFLGKGVSYCATCDGNFFRNKVVAVIGGANSAASAALYLSTLAQKVYIIYRKHEMRCEPISLTKLRENEKVEIIYFASPKKISGEKRVKQMAILIEEPEKERKERVLDLDAVFIEIGATPLTQVFKGLDVKTNCDGYIETDKEMKTSLEGVFAAGDNTDNFFKQMITAAGEGAVAAKSAHEFLRKK